MTPAQDEGWSPAYGVRVPIDFTGGPSRADLDHGDWRGDAECAREDDRWWFAGPATAEYRMAVTVCGECPVRRQCLAVALVYEEEFGIWAGTGARRRNTLVAQLRDGTPLGEVLDRVLDHGHHRAPVQTKSGKPSSARRPGSFAFPDFGGSAA